MLFNIWKVFFEDFMKERVLVVDKLNMLDKILILVSCIEKVEDVDRLLGI